MPDNAIPKRPLDPVGMEIYLGWLQAGLSPIEAYSKLEATRQMAGCNITASLEAIQAQISAFRTEVIAHRAELATKIKAQGAELGARIEAQGAALGAKIEANATELKAQRAEQKSLRSELTSKIEAHHKTTWALIGILAAAVFGLLTAIFFRPPPTPAPQSPAVVILGFPQASVAASTPVQSSSPRAGESPDSTVGR